jgi:peptidoglycan/xylan/chitin deacetylase (PgdA/CDA1 family)
MATLSEEQIRIEIETTQAKIERLAQERAVKLFRPPFGAYNNKLIAVCRDLGFKVIQWDVDSLDWKEYGVEHMYKQVTERVRQGSIILFHNNAKYIPQALPGILDNLIERGYSIVPISELVYKNSYYIDHTGRQIKIENTH